MKIIGEKINGTRKAMAAAIANRDAEFIQISPRSRWRAARTGWT